MLVGTLSACVTTGTTIRKQDASSKAVPLSFPEQQSAAFRSYHDCLVASAARSDDHMSDASTIARSMRGACYPEVLDLARATTGGMPVSSYYEECDRLVGNEFQAELQAVLDERRMISARHS